MIRISTQIQEEQLKFLKKIAKKKKTSVAGLIREAVEKYIGSDTTISDKEMRRRALEAAGCFNSGLTDLSEKHDEYFVEAVARKAATNCGHPKKKKRKSNNS